MDLNHEALVKLGYRWLMGPQKCSFALTELACSATQEIPDVFGYRAGYTAIVECKASRADFLSDRKKYYRRRPSMGLGAYRFYLCPEGMIRPEELPEKWGLLWVTGKGKVTVMAGAVEIGSAESFDWIHKRNVEAESGLMASALRRLQQHGVLPLVYESRQRGKKVTVKTAATTTTITTAAAAHHEKPSAH